MENINYEDFSKIKLKVAKVINVERVEGSEKLLKLEVSLGEDSPHRQIIAGIGKAYTPEEIRGKNIVIVANLEPRKLMGLESQGMLLAGSIGEEGPTLLTTDGPISPGAEVR